MIPFCFSARVCYGCYLQSSITRDDESHTILLRTQFSANAFPQIVYSTRRKSTRQSATTWTRLSPNSPDTKRWRHRSVSMCRPTIQKSTTIHTKHDAYHTHSIHTTPVSRLSTTTTTLCSNYCSKNDTQNTYYSVRSSCLRVQMGLAEFSLSISVFLSLCVSSIPFYCICVA